MNTFYYLLSSTATLLLSAAELSMLARAVLSWIIPDGEGFIIELIYILTEPMILPFRKLFERRGWFVDSPLDVPFFCTVLVLMIASTAVSLFSESIISF